MRTREIMALTGVTVREVTFAVLPAVVNRSLVTPARGMEGDVSTLLSCFNRPTRVRGRTGKPAVETHLAWLG